MSKSTRGVRDRKKKELNVGALAPTMLGPGSLRTARSGNLHRENFAPRFRPLSMQNLNLNEMAAVRIQRFWRRWRLFKHLRLLKNKVASVDTLDSRIEGLAGQRKRETAASIIQSYWRSYLIRKKWKHIITRASLQNNKIKVGSSITSFLEYDHTFTAPDIPGVNIFYEEKSEPQKPQPLLKKKRSNTLENLPAPLMPGASSHRRGAVHDLYSNQTIIGITVEKLFEKTTDPTDTELFPLQNKLLLYTYSAWIGTLDYDAAFINLLMSRYVSPGTPPNCQIETLRVLKTWVKSLSDLPVYDLVQKSRSKPFQDLFEFVSDEGSAQKLEKPTGKNLISAEIYKYRRSIIKSIHRYKTGHKRSIKQTLSTIERTDAKAPALKMPKNWSSVSLTTRSHFHSNHLYSLLSSIEVARQLTIIDHSMFKKIRSEEILSQRWTKKTKEIKCPNVMAIIKRFNTVTDWIALQILKEEKLDERAEMLDWWIEVGIEMIELRNYNGAMMVMGGLNESAISRLKQTWKKKKGKKKWERIVELLEIEGNYKRYRAEVKKEGVKVPIMGVVLQDLLFADEGNKGELEGVGGKGRKILNVVKWKMVGGMVEEVKEWQKENYCLESVDGLQRYLLEGIETSKGEGELFNLSLLREPRSK
eukprot:TRINITY_DN546_c0_g1_i1.p1 TRINITY_DN546_c0_g1~~TRINITY_DN546_c0_g1_i1.p1  ORF type:complete len:644 (-),score=159.88 TRINITY_DN546_c0_g1_i1:41-1972(-)